MTDDARITVPPQPDAGTATAPLPWFTAKEIPLPPPEMRRPPGEHEPGLFDDRDDDDE